MATNSNQGRLNAGLHANEAAAAAGIVLGQKQQLRRAIPARSSPPLVVTGARRRGRTSVLVSETAVAAREGKRGMDPRITRGLDPRAWRQFLVIPRDQNSLQVFPRYTAAFLNDVAVL